MANAEAVELAERSVAICGFLPDVRIPVQYSSPTPHLNLFLHCADILYNTSDKNRLANVLDELGRSLCRSGLVENGILGELIARTLLLIARDFAAPKKGKGRDLLAPGSPYGFPLRTFREEWAKSNKSKFETAFGNAHTNFTHWMITKDPMPEEPNSQLLPNLWARGAALQCCFKQEAVDFNIPIYLGSVAAAVFDPS